MAGPQPKPAALRRRKNIEPGFKLLPHEGRKGVAPVWPLPEHPDDRIQDLENRMWNRIWKLPQANEWERMRCEDVIALYVRTFVAAAERPTDFKLLAEVRQLDSKIGLSPRAMRDLRWETDSAPLDPEEIAPKAANGQVRAYVPEDQP